MTVGQLIDELRKVSRRDGGRELEVRFERSEYSYEISELKVCKDDDGKYVVIE